ncbi:ADP-ribose glycohydrolase MACROD2 [Grus japonensis]|uniref:ADP-ribose glycohydrolase MACROD2 n=1 Tax=Grus japonensis TaxID=30415 RepID=A0ABC9WT26_GRUJA
MYPGNKRKKLWREEKERLLKMTLEERRKEYLREYVPLKNIPTWMEDLSKSESDDIPKADASHLLRTLKLSSFLTTCK